MICVNTSHPDFIELQKISGLKKDLLKAKIGVWMEKNPSGSFPTLNDLGIAAKESIFDEQEKLSDEELPTDILGIPKSNEIEKGIDKKVSKEAMLYSKQNHFIKLNPVDEYDFNKLVEIIGYDEAIRDVIEQEGTVRSADVIFSKLIREKREKAALNLPKPEEDKLFSEVDSLNGKLESFLSKFGFTTVQLNDLMEVTGYSIAGATDFLEKTIFVKKNRIEDAYSKEAAYAIFSLLGKKNILRKNLIASIHLVDNYAELRAQYSTSNLSDYKIRELVAADYLRKKLIEAHNEGFLPNLGNYHSKDVTAKNKLEYAVLKIKQWWANIVRNYFKFYEKGYVEDLYNSIATDVINNNTRLFNEKKKQDYTKMVLPKRFKEINDYLVSLGAVNSGSYALNMQGTLTRKEMNDLDYFLPFHVKTKLIEEVQKKYPQAIFGKPFSGVMGNRSVTLSLQIGEVKIDFFLPTSQEESDNVKVVNINDVKYMHWKDIFDAKIRIGSKKHLTDLAGFVPFVKDFYTKVNVLADYRNKNQIKITLAEISSKQDELISLTTEYNNLFKDTSIERYIIYKNRDVLTPEELVLYDKYNKLSSKINDLNQDINDLKQSIEYFKLNNNTITVKNRSMSVIGQRHYNFDYVQSKFNKDYTTSEIIQEVSEVVGLNLPIKELVAKAKSFFEINKIDYKNSTLFKEIMAYTENESSAIAAYYKTFSEEFKMFYGNLNSRKNYTSFSMSGVNGNSIYNKPSVLVDEFNEPVLFYHGAGTRFDKFSKDYFLSGEGAMAYGAGFYATNYRPTADNYRDTSKAAMELFNKLLNEQNEQLLALMKEINYTIDESRISKLIKGSFTGFYNESSAESKLLNLLGLTETKGLYISLSNPIYWQKELTAAQVDIIEKEFNLKLKSTNGGKAYREVQNTLGISDKEVSARLYQAGIDGVINVAFGGTAVGGFSHKKGEIHAIFFEPVQAKATSNSGLFSLENENMYDPYVEVSAKAKQAEEKEEVIDELTTLEAVKNLAANENKQQAMLLMDKFSSTLGIDYTVISEKEFQKMFPESPLAAGFFKNGKVYFVEGLFNENTVLHEFAHPIIKAISKNNPELFAKLYSDLMSSEQGSKMFDLVSEEHPEHEPNSIPFMEEALVYAMEYMSNDVEYENKSWFKNLLFNIKQFLRTVFGKGINISKLNPNTTLSELATMLNAGEVFNMKPEFFNEDDVVMFQRKYEKEINEILNKDILNETQKTIDDFYSLVEKQVGNLTKGNSLYEMLKFELADDFNEGVLQTLRKNLNELATNGKKPVKPLDKLDTTVSPTNTDLDLIAEKINLFISSLVYVDKVFERLDRRAVALENNPNLGPEDFKDILSLQMYIENWNSFFNTMKQGYFSNFAISSNIVSLFNKGLDRVTNLNKRVSKIVTDVTFDAFYEHLKEINKPIEDLALEEMQALLDDGKYTEYELKYEEFYGITPIEKSELDTLEKQPKQQRESNSRYWYLKSKSGNTQSIDKEALRMLAGNLLGDSNYISGMIESYATNQDLIVSGFHNYISQFFNEVTANANSRQAILLNNLKSVLKGTSYGSRIMGEGALGKAISAQDTVYSSTSPSISRSEREELALLRNIKNKSNYEQDRYNELILKERGFEEVQEYVFISNFKNYRAQLTKLNNAIEDARIQYNLNPTPENKKAWRNALKDFKAFHADYMNRDGLDEVYQFDYMMDSPAGELADELIEDIFERMRQLDSNTLSDPTDFSNDVDKTMLWLEYRQLFSLYDKDGAPKQGIEKEVAELLTEYKEKTKDFYEINDIPNKFQDSFDQFIHELESQNLSQADMKLAIDNWIKYNTTVQIDDSYFEYRKQLIEEREGLMHNVIAINQYNQQTNNIVDVAPLYDEMYDILKTTKDDSGQYDGNLLTPSAQKRVMQLAVEIEYHKDSYLQLSGLTGAAYKEYVQLLEQDRIGFLNYNEQLKLDNYNKLLANRSKNLGISFSDLRRIREIDDELREMTQTQSTEVYVSTFNSFLLNDPALFDEFAKLVEDLFDEDLYTTGLVTENQIEFLLKQANELENIAVKYPKFLEFFENNHFVSEVVNYDSNGKPTGVTNIYKKSPAWSMTTPKDLNYYTSGAVNPTTLSNGNTLFPNGFIELNGIPRVPNMNYRKKQLKPEFERPKIERDYIDPTTGELILANVNNSGEWLPKTMDEGAKTADYINDDYKKMFNEKPALFKAMLFLKDHHLDNQRFMDRSQKLYLTYPFIRASKSETNVVGSIYRRREGLGGYFKHKFVHILNVFRKQNDDIDFGILNEDIASTRMAEPMRHPVSGMYRLPMEETSTNIVASLGIQAYSIENYKAVRKAMPFMQLFERAMKNIVTDPEIQNYKKKLQDLRLLVSMPTTETNRLHAIQNMIDKNLHGVEIKLGKTQGMRNFALAFLKLSTTLQNYASIKFFQRNPISSLVNYESGKIQLTARTQKWYNKRDLVATQGLSSRIVYTYMRSRYKKGPKNKLIQLMHVLDAIPGAMRKDAGALGARTWYADFKVGTQKFTSRKYTGESVPVHQMLAILRNKSFDLNGKKTPLYDAIGIDDQGRVVTVPGVPSEYQIAYDANDGSVILGKKLKEIMNAHQSILAKNIGASNEFNAPEMQRNIIAKYSLYIMKFLPPMTLGAYQVRTKKGVRGTARRNFSTQDKELGWLTGSLTSIYTILNSKKKLNKAQKNALYNLALLLLIDLLLRLLNDMYLGRYDTDSDGKDDYTFNPNDEHAFKMLRKANRVPQITVPGIGKIINPKYTTETGGDFSLEEWGKMHFLRTNLRGIREIENFLPVTPWDKANNGIALSLYERLTAGSIIGQTSVVLDIMKGGTAVIENDFYEQDAGPFIWQKGINKKFPENAKWYNNKAFNLVMQYQFGFDGKFIDPLHGLEADYSKPSN